MLLIDYNLAPTFEPQQELRKGTEFWLHKLDTREENTSMNRRDFPEDFVFGTATSSYQIEGHGLGGAGPCHWDSFSSTPGNVVRLENGARACEHYLRYREDLDLVAEVGCSAYRFSTSWARVMPEGKGKVNTAGLDFYDRLVDEMCARNLQPWWTLYHWELPSALADNGGWANRDTALRLADFAHVMADRIGDRVHAAAPINEPWCVAWLSHYLGHHAPGLKDIRMATRAMHHVLLAHGLVIEAWRGQGLENLGAVFNFEKANPGTNDDVEAAKEYDGIYNRWFMEAVAKGQYPADILAGLEPHMPNNWADDMSIIAQPVDWVGVNYYTGKRLTRGVSGTFGDIAELPPHPPVTAMEWEICADWLEEFLLRVDLAFDGSVPIYVTENGMASHSGTDDLDRIEYLKQHFKAARSAIDKGVDLRGYFVWSLMDNYEWSLGYDKRFGLVHVDFETMERTPKASYHWLQALLKN